MVDWSSYRHHSEMRTQSLIRAPLHALTQGLETSIGVKSRGVPLYTQLVVGTKMPLYIVHAGNGVIRLISIVRLSGEMSGKLAARGDASSRNSY